MNFHVINLNLWLFQRECEFNDPDKFSPPTQRDNHLLHFRQWTLIDSNLDSSAVVERNMSKLSNLMHLVLTYNGW